ncbi:heavy metal translocating P-type ATPase, partial [Acinetobacter baumannii]
RDKAIQIAASLDHLSGHPIAQAIVAGWSGELLDIEEFESVTGRGAKGRIDRTLYMIGNHRLIEELGICCDHVHTELDRLQAE